MLILKITEKGHYIEIPGMSPFRTPVEANISHVSINLVVSKLKTQGIKNFEIVSDTKGKEEILTQNDFMVENKKPKKQKDDNYERRLIKIEALLDEFSKKQTSKENLNEEQITNKLSNIEKLLMNQTQETSNVVSTPKKLKKIKTKRIKKEPVIEEMDNTFIPSINLDGLEIKGNSQKTIKQDKQDIDDSADLLSRIMQSED